jgi:hypothetical protein
VFHKLFGYETPSSGVGSFACHQCNVEGYCTVVNRTIEPDCKAQSTCLNDSASTFQCLFWANDTLCDDGDKCTDDLCLENGCAFLDMDMCLDPCVILDPNTCACTVVVADGTPCNDGVTQGVCKVGVCREEDPSGLQSSSTGEEGEKDGSGSAISGRTIAGTATVCLILTVESISRAGSVCFASQ